MKKYMKFIILLGVIIFFIVGLTWPGNDKFLKGIYNIEISIKDYGKMKLELYADKAPITVTNFVDLVNKKFYDGLTMHRIIDGFMIQGGDPNKDGTGSTNPIKGEFKNNGVDNDISHARGVISMARNANDMDSGSCQFFIMHKDNTYLDGDYASFGKVTSGIEVVDKIVKKVSKLGDDNGLIPEDKQPVIEYIKVIKSEK